MEPDDQSNIPTKPFIVPGTGDPSLGVSNSIAAALLGAGRSMGSGGAWQPPAPEELQRDFPLYEITAVLGRGGMGAVYKGWQKSLDRFVAIKILPPGLDDGIAGFTERFKREAKAMAQLKHPGIVAVYDAGTTAGGLLYFVMECVEGTDVHRLVSERGRLDPGEALRITGAVCDALGYAHERGIIHRDIKPSNIMIETGGAVKVADFGLAKSVSAATTMLTMTNVAMGTPDFMAPEALKGAANADHRADLYAVGVMLYQMLTGELPRGRFVPPSRAVPGLDKRLDLIVDKALQPEPAARYSTAIEVKAAIEPVTRAIAKRTVAIARASTPRKKPPLLAIGSAIAVLAAIAALVHFAPWKKGGPTEAIRPATPQPSQPEVPKLAGAGQITKELWQDVLHDPAKLSLNGSVERVPEGLRFKGDGGAARLQQGPWRNGALRMRATFGGTAVGPRARQAARQADGQYSLECTGGNEVVLQRSQINTPLTTLGRFPLSEPLRAGQDYELELRIVGDRLTALCNGQVLGTVTDSTCAEGTWELNANEHDGRLTLVKALEVLNLDGIPEAEALKLAGVDGTDKPSSAPYPKLDAAGNPVFAPGVWTRMWTAAEEARNGDKKDGGWLLPSNVTRGRSGPFINAGMRARFRNQLVTDRFHPQINLRAPNVSAMNLHLNPEGEKLQIRDARTGAGLAVLADLRLPEPVRAGEEYQMEFYTIGQKLIGRVNGQTVTATITGATSPGPLSIYMANADYVRDVEVLNLDGLPEAEALKLAGVSSTSDPQAPPSAAATFAGHRYLVVKDQLQWPQAKAKAEAMGGHLATITSKEEWAAVQKILMESYPLGKQREVWLGGELDAGGAWKWVTAEPFAFTAWTPGRPEKDGHRWTNARFDPVRGVWAWWDFHDAAEDALAKGIRDFIGGYVVEWEDAGSAATPATKDAPFVNGLGMKFVPVPITGGPTDKARVLFSVWETRVQDYEAFATETRREWPKLDFLQGPTHPAANVSWEDAAAFCKWLTERERKAGKLGTNELYRLPSDHEWSCAVGIGEREDPAKLPAEKHGAIKGVFPWGTAWPPPPRSGNLFDERAHRSEQAATDYVKGYDDGHPALAPVGSFLPSALGIYDLAGNVEEWCLDRVRPDKTGMAIRGSSWLGTDEVSAVSSRRAVNEPTYRTRSVGFRTVLAPTP